MNEKKTFNIYGRQPVIEALRSDYTIYEIQLAHDLQGKVVKHIISLARKKNVPVKNVSKNDIQKITGPVVHQGIAAQMQEINLSGFPGEESLFANGKTPFLVIADQVQDPHNLGAILRTAEIVAADWIILPIKGSAELNATVAKTSVGAMFHLKICLVDDLAEAIIQLNDWSVKTFALSAGSEHNMYKQDLTTPLVLVIGSEGIGVRANILRLCSNRLSIPQWGKIGSLNASVAAALAMYEVRRQRSY